MGVGLRACCGWYVCTWFRCLVRLIIGSRIGNLEFLGYDRLGCAGVPRLLDFEMLNV